MKYLSVQEIITQWAGLSGEQRRHVDFKTLKEAWCLAKFLEYQDLTGKRIGMPENYREINEIEPADLLLGSEKIQVFEQSTLVDRMSYPGEVFVREPIVGNVYPYKLLKQGLEEKGKKYPSNLKLDLNLLIYWNFRHGISLDTDELGLDQLSEWSSKLGFKRVLLLENSNAYYLHGNELFK